MIYFIPQKERMKAKSCFPRFVCILLVYEQRFKNLKFLKIPSTLSGPQ